MAAPQYRPRDTAPLDGDDGRERWGTTGSNGSNCSQGRQTIKIFGLILILILILTLALTLMLTLLH